MWRCQEIFYRSVPSADSIEADPLWINRLAVSGGRHRLEAMSAIFPTLIARHETDRTGECSSLLIKHFDGAGDWHENGTAKYRNTGTKHAVDCGAKLQGQEAKR